MTLHIRGPCTSAEVIISIKPAITAGGGPGSSDSACGDTFLGSIGLGLRREIEVLNVFESPRVSSGFQLTHSLKAGIAL